MLNMEPLSIHCRLGMKITFHIHLTITKRITAQLLVFFKRNVCENIRAESVQRPLVEYPVYTSSIQYTYLDTIFKYYLAKMNIKK